MPSSTYPFTPMADWSSSAHGSLPNLNHARPGAAHYFTPSTSSPTLGEPGYQSTAGAGLYHHGSPVTWDSTPPSSYAHAHYNLQSSHGEFAKFSLVPLVDRTHHTYSEHGLVTRFATSIFLQGTGGAQATQQMSTFPAVLLVWAGGTWAADWAA